MVVLIVPAPLGILSAIPIIMQQTEQIVKTSGNLLTSFLIQGGGFKFYQSGSTGQEGIILKAKLVGAARFIFKRSLEGFRESKRFVTLLASNFGLETGLILNTLELNTNKDQRDVINLTMSFQKVIPSKASLLSLSNIIFSLADLTGVDDVRFMPLAQSGLGGVLSAGSVFSGVGTLLNPILDPIRAIDNGAFQLPEFQSRVTA